QILCAAFLLNTVARLSSALAMAIERPGYMMTGSLVTIFSNIAVSIVLIKIMGFSGVAWGTVAAVNCGTVYFLYRLHKDLAITGRQYLAVSGSFVLAGVPAALAIALVNWGTDRFLGQRGRLLELCILAVEAVLFVSLYAQALVRARLFTQHDLAFLKEKFPAGYAGMSVLLGIRNP
ncbi:MAG: polysaccharide biosynthesis C-terminal domain-containing protein, partial [Candidatus Omnitrophica bacterium]|nr:polysaccharide biosynthesis C-terminal domain-containing protein [Candidatus Omnitrophota bacterium]